MWFSMLLCFGVSFCTVLPSVCLGDICLGLGDIVATCWERAAHSVNRVSICSFGCFPFWVRWHDHGSDCVNSCQVIACLVLFISPQPQAHQVTFTFFKDLLRNHSANQSQILCGASLGKGNKRLFMASGSHDLVGRHAHI